MKFTLSIVVILAAAIVQCDAIRMPRNAAGKASGKASASGKTSLGARNACYKLRRDNILFGGTIDNIQVGNLEECKSKLDECIQQDTGCKAASFLTKSKSCLIYDITPEERPQLVLQSTHGILIQPGDKC